VTVAPFRSPVASEQPRWVHVSSTHLLLVYPWRITSEGTRRVKAGRADLDYRIRGGRK